MLVGEAAGPDDLGVAEDDETFGVPEEVAGFVTVRTGAWVALGKTATISFWGVIPTVVKDHGSSLQVVSFGLLVLLSISQHFPIESQRRLPMSIAYQYWVFVVRIVKGILWLLPSTLSDWESDKFSFCVPYRSTPETFSEASQPTRAVLDVIWVTVDLTTGEPVALAK